MRRDLDIDCDPSELVLAPPDRSQLREMFRRFEFRNLLNRVDELDEAVPARERIVAGTAVAVARGRAARAVAGRVGLAIADEPLRARAGRRRRRRRLARRARAARSATPRSSRTTTRRCRG